MSLDTALRAHLVGKAAITAITDNRVLFGSVDPSREELPHIVISIEDHDISHTLDVAVDLQFPTAVVEIRSDDFSDIDTLSDLVRRSLLELEFGATVGAETIECLTLVDGGTDETPVTIRDDDDTVRVYRRLLMAEVGYKYDLSAVT